MKIAKTILKFILGSISNTIYLLGCVFIGAILSFHTSSGEELLGIISTINDIVMLQQAYTRLLETFLMIGIFIEIIKTIFKVLKNKGI